MDANEILNLLTDFLVEYGDQNNELVRIDTDGVAKLDGYFDLQELADFLNDHING